jgi:hypothetical protein
MALRNGLDQSESFLSNSLLVLRAVDLFASLGGEMQSSPMAQVTNSVGVFIQLLWLSWLRTEVLISRA